MVELRLAGVPSDMVGKVEGGNIIIFLGRLELVDRGIYYSFLKTAAQL